MKSAIFRYIADYKWSILTIIIVALILFKISRDVIHATQINIEMAKLKREKREYQNSITRDSTLIEELKTDEELIRYAREQYLMKRDDEDIYIIK